MRKFIAVLLLFSAINSVAQDQDSLQNNFNGKNIFKWNASAWLLWGKGNYIFSYERVLKNDQSFSISAGHRIFPRLLRVGLADSTFIVREHLPKTGFSINLDYRFYFSSRNKFPTPDGLYWGPFFNYYNSKFKNSFNVYEDNLLQENVVIDTKFRTANVGILFGYQMLVMKNRVSIDAVFFGPAFSSYRIKMVVLGDFTPNEENTYYLKLKQLIENRFPLLEDLFEDAAVDSSGTLDKLGPGWVYNVSIGYRF